MTFSGFDKPLSKVLGMGITSPKPAVRPKLPTKNLRSAPQALHGIVEDTRNPFSARIRTHLRSCGLSQSGNRRPIDGLRTAASHKSESGPLMAVDISARASTGRTYGVGLQLSG